MQTPYKTKLPRNSRSKLLLFSILAFLVSAGPAITLQSPGKALMAGTSNSSSLSNSAQSYDGAVTTANCTMIAGWAIDVFDETIIVFVDIYINGVLKATLPANRCMGLGGYNCHNFRYTIPTSLKDGQEMLVDVKFSNTNDHLAGSPQTIRCGAMLFPGSSPPGPVFSGSGQGQTWEQSIHFTSTEAGEITHVRFWKVAGESGSHIGRIWSDTGTLLRYTDPFPIKPVEWEGWLTAPLTSSLPITAGTKYRVSYNVNYYGGKILSFLNSPYINEPLIAWRGFYTTPAGTFPNTGSVSNFLADVILNVPK